MASTNRTLLKDLTECSICYSPLLEPKILQCGHTFCFECVKRLCQTATGQLFECPECRTLHSTHHHLIPTDFKLKQVVEMMHKMGNDQPGNQTSKICSSCASCGDIKNYFICETCTTEDLMQVYCSLCIVKKHQSHTVKEALDEAKLSTELAIDTNMHIINQVMHDTEFYRKRYELQNEQITYIFQLFLKLSESTKESLKENFQYGHARLSEILRIFLESTHTEINRIFNETDNYIYHLSTGILNAFEQQFQIPPIAMEELKTKITNKENIDLFSFLFNNLKKDDLPSFDRPSSSAEPAVSSNICFDNNTPSGFNPILTSQISKTATNNLGFGQKVYRNKKKR